MNLGQQGVAVRGVLEGVQGNDRVETLVLVFESERGHFRGLARGHGLDGDGLVAEEAIGLGMIKALDAQDVPRSAQNIGFAMKIDRKGAMPFEGSAVRTLGPGFFAFGDGDETLDRSLTHRALK
jgi:hypothetical protein